MALKVKEGSVTAQGFTLVQDEIPAENENYKVKVTAHLANGKTLAPVELDVLSEYIPVDTVTIGGDSAISDYGNHTYTLIFSREDGRTPNVGVTSYSIAPVDGMTFVKEGNTFLAKVDDGITKDEAVTIVVTANLADGKTVSGSVTVNVELLPVTGLDIIGKANVKGSGEKEMHFTFGYTPKDYNIQPSVPVVSCADARVTISNVTAEGFDAKFQISEGDSYSVAFNASMGAINAAPFTVSILYSDALDYEAVDLGLPSGRLWANMNIGAKKPEDYGQYFAWGATVGNGSTGGNYAWPSAYDSVQGYPQSGSIPATLDAAHDAATVNMGEDWRMPDKTDIDELLNTANCTNAWTTVNGVNGRLFTSVRNGKTLFFPAAGGRGDSSLYNAGSRGFVWSRSFDSGNNSWYLGFNSGSCSAYINSRDSGFSVRGVR